MDKKKYESWDRAMKKYAEMTGKSLKEIQDIMPLKEMKIGTEIFDAIVKILQAVAKSDEPTSHVKSAIRMLISPLPLDYQASLLLDMISVLEDLAEL